MISLEVAEHITEQHSERFIEFITSHCDQALFSAAIPNQTGNGHVNEQWPTFWAKLFKKYGFIMLDTIRKQIWGNTRIPFWYRQNCFLVKRSGLDIQYSDEVCPASNLVHPEQFHLIYEIIKNMERNSLKARIINKFRRIFHLNSK